MLKSEKINSKPVSEFFVYLDLLVASKRRAVRQDDCLVVISIWLDRTSLRHCSDENQPSDEQKEASH